MPIIPHLACEDAYLPGIVGIIKGKFARTGYTLRCGVATKLSSKSITPFAVTYDTQDGALELYMYMFRGGITML
jgi:hypothetical protein